MRTRVDRRFLDEVRTFRLRFDCEACGWLASDAQRCALGHPTAPHRRRDLEGAEDVVFCKDFESAV